VSTHWMSKLTKDFGKLAEDMPKPQDNVISLPSPSFNWAVGNGGIVQGKAVCLFGPESGGKSLLMQLIMARIQQADPEAIGILFDAEYSFNPEWFKKLGGDTNRLIVRQSNDPLKIFDYMSPEGEMYEMLQDGAPIKFVGIDSIKAIRYPKDIKSKSTDQVMGGGGASYLGSALKGVLPVIREFNVTTIMVQQVYEEMDQYKKMNNPYIVPDGRALKHFCDYMIQVEKLETKAGRIEEGTNIHGGAQQVGHIIRAKCKKNRLAAPYRTAQLTLRYEGGITDTDVELFDLAKSLGIIYHPTKDGKVNNQMWQVGNHEPIRGEANIRNFVLSNPEVQKEIELAINGVSEEVVRARNEDLKMSDIDIDLDNI
jgi:recombination protein RecA